MKSTQKTIIEVQIYPYNGPPTSYLFLIIICIPHVHYGGPTCLMYYQNLTSKTQMCNVWEYILILRDNSYTFES